MSGEHAPGGVGPQLALVGSGEFLPVMAAVDAALLRGRAPRAVFLPTAAALDGAARVQYWIDLVKAGVHPPGIVEWGTTPYTR